MAILKRQGVVEATGMCYTSIYNKMKAGTFPKSRKLGVRSVGWIKEEVEKWIADLECSEFKALN
jgi:prophage regulatory protein